MEVRFEEARGRGGGRRRGLLDLCGPVGPHACDPGLGVGSPVTADLLLCFGGLAGYLAFVIFLLDFYTSSDVSPRWGAAGR